MNKVNASSGQNPVTGTSYNVFGEATAVNFGSGDSDAFQYDANTGRVTQYKYTVNGSSVTGNLTWNANGSLKTLAITDAFNSSNQQTCNYAYDDLARIASANCGSIWNETFAFDAFGNIQKTGLSGATSLLPTYSWSTNHMTALGGLTPTYDANGNLTYDTYNNYTWDAEGRMATKYDISLGSGKTVTYDAVGRWVEESTNPPVQEVYDPTARSWHSCSDRRWRRPRFRCPEEPTPLMVLPECTIIATPTGWVPYGCSRTPAAAWMWIRITPLSVRAMLPSPLPVLRLSSRGNTRKSAIRTCSTFRRVAHTWRGLPCMRLGNVEGAPRSRMQTMPKGGRS